MGLKRRVRSWLGVEERESLEDVLLKAGLLKDNISSKEALEIPAVASSVELISNTVAILPIKLYKRKDKGEEVEEIKDDRRIHLLNSDTGDTLDAFQFKKALVSDYLLHGNAYAYINKDKNDTKSLHYVESGKVTVRMSVEAIHKDYELMVDGEIYRPFEFITITRSTKDGVLGKGIIDENKKILSVAYNSLEFENMLMKTGGNKKGFLKAESRLSKEAIAQLKKAWNDMYKNNTENVIVLNQGLDFQESSATSVEMQLNENKKTNSNDIYKLFNVSPGLMDGSAGPGSEEYNNFVKVAVLPILKSIETALNKSLLLEKEKETFYFAFDTKDLLKADIETRFNAYEKAVKNGWFQIDDVRLEENMEPLGIDFVKLGLQDVLYYPDRQEIYNPNMDRAADLNNLDTTSEGGEDNKNRDKEQQDNN